jgi:hypothetical protein
MNSFGAMNMDLMILVCCFLIVLTHELSHAAEARWEGIFKKFSWEAFGPSVSLTRPSSHRYAYLAGIVGSFSVLPLWIYSVELPYFEGLALFVALALTSGSLDLLCFWKYSEVIEERLKAEAV